MTARSTPTQWPLTPGAFGVIGVAGYGTYYVDTWYVDGFLAYGSVDYDSTRKRIRRVLLREGLRSPQP